MVRTIVAAVKESNLQAVMPTDLSVTDSKAGLNRSDDAMNMTNMALGSKLGFNSTNKSQDSKPESQGEAKILRDMATQTCEEDLVEPDDEEEENL